MKVLGSFQQAGVVSDGTNGASHLDNHRCFYTFNKRYNKQGRTSESSTFMSRIFFRLPIILFTILLGMSFQYAAAAGSVSIANQSVNLNHSTDLHGTNLFFVSDKLSNQTHQGSDVNDSQTGQACSSGSCTSCALKLSPAAMSPVKYIPILVLAQKTDRFVIQLSSPLFRPPKI